MLQVPCFAFAVQNRRQAQQLPFCIACTVHLPGVGQDCFLLKGSPWPSYAGKVTLPCATAHIRMTTIPLQSSQIAPPGCLPQEFFFPREENTASKRQQNYLRSVVATVRHGRKESNSSAPADEPGDSAGNAGSRGGRVDTAAATAVAETDATPSGHAAGEWDWLGLSTWG